MFEIICDSCGESIGSCSKDLSNETVYCEECTPSTDDPDDDDPVADDTKKEEEEEA